MAIVDCPECHGTGYLCSKKGCHRKRHAGDPHKECRWVRPKKCPRHVETRVFCDACGADNIIDWSYRSSDFGKLTVLCGRCNARFEEVEEELKTVLWDAFLMKLGTTLDSSSESR